MAKSTEPNVNWRSNCPTRSCDVNCPTTGDRSSSLGILYILLRPRLVDEAEHGPADEVELSLPPLLGQPAVQPLERRAFHASILPPGPAAVHPPAARPAQLRENPVLEAPARGTPSRQPPGASRFPPSPGPQASSWRSLATPSAGATSSTTIRIARVRTGGAIRWTRTFTALPASSTATVRHPSPSPASTR